MKEKVRFNEEDLRRISQMTDSNAHTEARIFICQRLNENKLLRAYDGLAAAHDFLIHKTSIAVHTQGELEDIFRSKVFNKAENPEEIWNCL